MNVAPFLGFILLFSSRVMAEDWPFFLGPNHNGISTETNLIEKFSTNGPPLVWEKAVGTGYSAPSIRNGKLILFHRVGDEEIIEAFDPGTGKPIWRHAYPTRFQDPYGYNNGPRCSPVLSSDHCFTFGAEGMLTCVQLSDGKKVWQRNTSKEWEVPEAFFGVGASPVIEGELLLVMVGGQPNSGMVGFDLKTGKTVWESVGEKNWTGVPMTGWPGERKVEWRSYEKQASYATPVVATVDGQRIAFCLMRQGLVALNPMTGAVLDSFWFRARVDESVNAANPVVSGNQILISSAYFKNGSVLLKLDPATKKFSEVWRGLNLELHFTTPILFDGHLYAFSGRNEPDARFRCVEFNTGKIKWDRSEQWRAYSTKQPPVYGRGSAILADGKLIVLGEGGLLGLFQVSSDKDVELARWQVPQIRYPAWTAPILSERRLYLRSEDRLLCYDFAKK